MQQPTPDIKLWFRCSRGNGRPLLTVSYLYSDQVLLLTRWDTRLLTRELTVQTEHSDEFQRKKDHLVAQIDDGPLEVKQPLLQYEQNKTKMLRRTGR
jgi:hypothetical protein